MINTADVHSFSFEGGIVVVTFTDMTDWYMTWKQFTQLEVV